MKTKTKFDLINLVRKNIRKLKPYQSARDRLYKDAILMDANENPFTTIYNRYPDPFQRALKTKISKIKNVSTDQIFLGNGSDEIIDVLIRAFCDPGMDSILINAPTYGMYKVCANINNVNVIKVDLDNNFQLDVDLILKKSKKSKIIFICSPNNPTGNLMNKEDVFLLINQFQGLVVIDEAYIDFSDDPGFISEIDNFPNLIVLQTFSKAQAMAGIRLGMAFMNSEIVQILNKLKYPYNISTLNQQAALESLKKDTTKDSISAILKQKNWLGNELNKLTLVKKIWPSDANFLLVKFNNHQDVFDFLVNERIIVRDRSNEPSCDGCLRITIGKSLENLMLISCLKYFERIKFKTDEKNTVLRS